MTDTFSKLPLLAKPSAYDLHLKPCLKTFKCPGTASIELEVLEKTNFFTLHANQLEINSAKLQLSDGKVLENLSVELDKKWNLLTVKFPVELEPKSNVKLDFVYAAELNNIMQGFSRSVYKNKDGEDKFMASTQFESTYARQSFPCWDEPTYKAKFNVELEVDESLTALSNMNVVTETKTDNGKKLVKFAPTPVMSPYLVAFAVGEFEYIETKTKGGILMRVYTVEGKKHLAQYALDLSAKFMDFYEEWFGIKCPLPKCDLIAIPDFSMGAMENWGLITYREICLLVDPVKTSTLVKSHVALVVAHELAHFWFGNLVTMKWWTDLWLKEGYASFMEYFAVSKACPEYDIFLHFINDEVASAFALDSLRSSHPIEMEISNPNELDEIYDSITYSKSNSAIRMLYSHLGEPTFQKGLRLYLQKYQYSNAVTVDLWNALSEASGQDVNSMMSSWTQKMGFPIVSVKQQVDGDKRVLSLSQERFLADGTEDETHSIWQIPISVITASSPNTPIHKSLLKEKTGQIVLDGVKPGDWVKLNAELTGFYRVQYSADMLKAILPAVQSKQLGTIDRCSIASDLWALVRSGKAPASQFLHFIQACKNEDQYIVWCAISQGISNISNIIDYMDNDKELKPKFDHFICKVLEPIAERLGWEPKPEEDSHTGLLRAVVLGHLLKCKHKNTVQEAMVKFEEHVTKKADLVADLRSTIYSAVGRTNKTDALSTLKKIFKTVGLSEVERQCATAMAQTTDIKLLDDVFNYFIEEGNLRSQDYMTLFVSATTSRAGKEFTWQYFKKNVHKLVNIYGSVNSSLFQRLLRFSIDGSCSGEFTNEVMAFFKSEFDEHSQSIFARPLNQSIEKVRLNEKLLKANAEDIDTFFGNQ